MTPLPIDVIDKNMLFQSHPIADMIILSIIRTAWASYMHLNQGVRWLVADDSANMNSNAYEMYVLSKCIRHKHQVRYISDVKTLDRLFYNFNSFLITDALARELTLQYAYDDYLAECDDCKEFHYIMHNLIVAYEN